MNNTLTHALWQNLKLTYTGIPLAIVIILTVVMLPLPPFLLDMLFTFNITLALMVLLACIYTKKPLAFSVFPTLLLITTLLRLALNIASTRLVLLQGQTGPGAAGQVIKSFGEVVIGGNYAVGIVIFAILVVINFVVVTKGAGRISEVSARFTLDAMPGKQMAIDADFNAGLISQKIAKKRRREVQEEANFYGAMDGASKFVRGDAIAGLLILFINMVGGFIIGMSAYHMTLGAALHTYLLLVIGDGLATQIPALLLSTAAAIMVTRVSSTQLVGQQVKQQLLHNHPQLLMAAAAMIGSLGLIPGMPHVAFLSIALATSGMAYLIKRKAMIATENSSQVTAIKESGLDWRDIKAVDIIRVEIGYQLIPLVAEETGAKLMQKISSIRRKLSTQLGFLIPSICVKDNIELPPHQYRILLLGVVMGYADIYSDKMLAINPGHISEPISGIRCQDPTFGLAAYWINLEQRESAQQLGYTVVDACTVIGTHVNHILQTHSAQLFGHEEAQHILTKLAEIAPKLAEALIPHTLPLYIFVKILQQLLAENIPIIDIRSIAESLIEYGAKSQDPHYLTSMVRIHLKNFIIQHICGNSNKFSAVTLSPELEQLLHQSQQLASDHNFSLEPGLAEKLHGSLLAYEHEQITKGEAAILLVSPTIRSHLAHLFRNSIPKLNILSYQELPSYKEVNIVGSIGA